MEPTPPSVEWKSHFTPSQQDLTFQWKPPESDDGEFINPVGDRFTFADLLLIDAFFDKSAALYNLIERCFEGSPVNDFWSVVLLLVYPGQFGKTTLLAFMEAVFSPVPMWNNKFETREVLKTKISTLACGNKLLEFGLHPVLYLDLQEVRSVDNLNQHIAARLERAGLNSSEVAKVNEGNLSSTHRVKDGVAMLADKFTKETGAASNTIVLMDEYDKPFRDGNRRQDDELLTELNHIFELGNNVHAGSRISLLVLCGLTRMAGLGVTQKVDVSQDSDYHGLCGISANELVTSCTNGQLDRAERTLESLVAESGMGGFRFGFDNVKMSSEHELLISPLDVWEIVGSILNGKNNKPHHPWKGTVTSNFDFASFAENFTSSDEGYKELLKTLEEGWVDPTDEGFNLNRDQYLLLDNDLHVKKVLLELGLLTVKATNDDDILILLGPPNKQVKRTAAYLLKTKRKEGLKKQKLKKLKTDEVPLEFEKNTVPETSSIPDSIAAGDVVTIHRNETNGTRVVPVFFRTHFVHKNVAVDEFWNSPSRWKLYVTGAPGCGKTCFFWTWAERLRQNKKKILFILFRGMKKCEIWVLEGNERKRLKSPILKIYNLCRTTERLLDGTAFSEAFDVCICDGVRTNEERCREMLSLLDSMSGDKQNAKIGKLILVTSLQFDIKLGDEMSAIDDFVANISFESWTWADYESAAKSRLVEMEPTRSQLLHDWNESRNSSGMSHKQKILEVMMQKYYYAGGSARFMFEMNMEQLLKAFDALFARVLDWTAFTKTAMSFKTLVSVNSLMQYFSRPERGQLICTPVSKYVLICAYDHCRSKLTDAVKAAAIATNNASLRGWGYEMGQNDIIDSALAANCSGSYSSYFTAAAVKNSKLFFFPKSKNVYNEGNIEGNVVSGAVIRGPFDRGLLDVALYFGTTLVTLQFTISERRSLKLEYLTSIRNALLRKGLQVTRMAHLAVLEQDMLGRFNFDKATGAVLGPDENRRLRSNNITPREVEVGESEELTKVERFTLLGRDTVQTLKKIYHVPTRDHEIKLEVNPNVEAEEGEVIEEEGMVVEEEGMVVEEEGMVVEEEGMVVEEDDEEEGGPPTPLTKKQKKKRKKQ